MSYSVVVQKIGDHRVEFSLEIDFSGAMNVDALGLCTNASIVFLAMPVLFKNAAKSCDLKVIVSTMIIHFCASSLPILEFISQPRYLVNHDSKPN